VTSPPGSPATGRRTPPLAWFGPWCAVALVSLWGLWNLRAELTAVPYLDDSSMHEQMVRFAAARISQGHLPLTSWFPYLGLGSPHFLHYQSLPAMVTGLIGTMGDPDTVFRWTLYLLWALWPLSIYWSARLFRLSRWTAAAAAAVAPFLVSAAGIGYETTAYVWAGYGVWTQLWAGWTLALAWGFTSRALSGGSRRTIVAATLFVTLTIALHFETGYLAFVPLFIWPFLVPSELRRRLGTAVVIGAGSALAAAWVIYPVLAQSHFAARNQVLGQTPLENGYGAGQVLRWLLSGQLFDDGRLAVVTIFMFVGIVLCLFRWKESIEGRALVTVWAVTLLMTFGRTTFGSLYALVPGSSDIFIRRFQMGVHLSGVLLAGVGVVGVGQLARAALRHELPEVHAWLTEHSLGRSVFALSCIVSLLVLLTPAWRELDTYDAHNARNISLQAAADAQSDPQIDQLLSYVRAHPSGRVYAGLPTNWGSNFLVGAVPVFKYVESRDIDEVGYTLRTASLMTDPEFHFEETNPGDYVLFGIAYVLVPNGQDPSVPASLVRCAGIYCLWALPSAGYVHVFDTIGTLTATRADVGSQSVALLSSDLPSEHRALTVAFNGNTAAPVTAPHPSALRGAPGRVVASHADLAGGQATATVVVRRRSVVVLSASFDPGWVVSVDGHPARTVMIAPALVGVTVPPGQHRIAFRYVGFGSYDGLWLVSLSVLALLALGPRLRRITRRRTGGRHPAATG